MNRRQQTQMCHPDDPTEPDEPPRGGGGGGGRGPQQDATRRTSEFYPEHEQMDLRRDYENAVDCLVSCEHIIKSLQGQLASRDAELASKDEAISSLECKIVDMSLELATTLQREEELKYRLQKATAVPPPPPPPPPKEVSFLVSSSSPHPPPPPPPTTEALIAFNLQSKYKPISKSGKKGRNYKEPASFANKGAAKAEASFNTAATSFTTTTCSRTSLTSSNSIVRQVQQGHPSASNNTGDAAGGLSGIGRFFLQRGRTSPQDNAPVPSREGSSRPTAPWSTAAARRQDASPPCRPSRVATSAQRANRLKKSSRSFLEASGVVFPVSSFEVLDKGCIMRTISKGSKGALAHGAREGSKNCLRAGSSSMDLLARGCMAKRSKGGLNEEWPEL